MAWAVWWGGLTFYGAVVVPIGAQVIGSVEQGFITQRVSLWIYAFTILYLMLVLPDVWRHGRLIHRIAWGTAIGMFPGLWFLHRHLSAMLDPATRTIHDDAPFYSWHAIYLWLIAVQWLCGLILGLMSGAGPGRGRS